MPPSATAFPCCRDHDLFAPVEEYPQRIQRTPGDEAYWFDWDSSFDGKTTILIARLGGEAMVSNLRRPKCSRAGDQLCGSAVWSIQGSEAEAIAPLTLTPAHLTNEQRNVLRPVALAYRRAYPSRSLTRGLLNCNAALPEYRVCPDAPIDQIAASREVNRMVAAAINADAKWFWHGPDV